MDYGRVKSEKGRVRQIGGARAEEDAKEVLREAK